MRKFPVMVQEIFTLEEGPIHITYPDRLSPESLEVALEWLDLLKKKLVRWQMKSDCAPDPGESNAKT